MWPVLLAVFAVNAQGISYSPAQFLFLVVLALLVSIGTVGVPGTATITATSLFAAAGLPIPFIAISQPISQIVDMGRTALNVAGAANTAVIVAATEKDLDKDLYLWTQGFEDEDASEDEDAVAPRNRKPSTRRSAGGRQALRFRCREGRLFRQPAELLSSLRRWRAPVRNNAASSFQEEGLILRLQGTLPGPSPWFSP